MRGLVEKAKTLEKRYAGMCLKNMTEAQFNTIKEDFLNAGYVVDCDSWSDGCALLFLKYMKEVVTYDRLPYLEGRYVFVDVSEVCA